VARGPRAAHGRRPTLAGGRRRTRRRAAQQAAAGVPGRRAARAYGDWGPPPNGSAPVVAVGLPLADLARLRGCHVVARIDNGLAIDNDEQGTHVDVCRGPVRPWSQEWPALRHLG
jgi:hypothetical protein